MKFPASFFSQFFPVRRGPISTHNTRCDPSERGRRRLDRVHPTPSHIPRHATRNFVAVRTTGRTSIDTRCQSTERRGVRRSAELGRLYCATFSLMCQWKRVGRALRNQFLFTWAQSNSDIWLLFLSTHSTSKLCCHKRVRALTKLRVLCWGIWLVVVQPSRPL